MRMGNRPMTWLTNAFLKESREPRVYDGIYFMHYGFVRNHETLKITPVMAAGVNTDKLWEMPDMVKVLDDWERRA